MFSGFGVICITSLIQITLIIADFIMKAGKNLNFSFVLSHERAGKKYFLVY